MDIIIEALKEFGLPIVLLGIMFYWAYKKDQRQEDRYDGVIKKLNQVQDEQRAELLDISRRAIAAQEHSIQVQIELIEQFKSRPCMREV